MRRRVGGEDGCGERLRFGQASAQPVRVVLCLGQSKTTGLVPANLAQLIWLEVVLVSLHTHIYQKFYTCSTKFLSYLSSNKLEKI